MSDFVDSIKEDLRVIADERLRERGIKVTVKTNLTPALKVFDATEPATPPSMFGRFVQSLFKAGVRIEDKNGKVLYSTELPKTDFIKVAALSIAGVSLVALFARGVFK